MITAIPHVIQNRQIAFLGESMTKIYVDDTEITVVKLKRRTISL